MRRLTTVQEVVSALGGIPAVCELTGANLKAVYHWTGRANMFPARTYWIMQIALRRREASAPARLWNMVGAKRHAEKRAA